MSSSNGSVEAEVDSDTYGSGSKLSGIFDTDVEVTLYDVMI